MNFLNANTSNRVYFSLLFRNVFLKITIWHSFCSQVQNCQSRARKIHSQNPILNDDSLEDRDFSQWAGLRKLSLILFSELANLFCAEFKQQKRLKFNVIKIPNLSCAMKNKLNFEPTRVLSSFLGTKSAAKKKDN